MLFIAGMSYGHGLRGCSHSWEKDMIVLLCFALIMIPWLFGRSFLLLFGRGSGEKMYRGDFILTGWIICIGLAEAAHLVAVLLGQSFSRTVNLIILMYGVLGALCVIILSVHALICRRSRGRGRMALKPSPIGRRQMVFSLLAVGVFLSQILFLILGSCEYRQWDMTLETVQSILETDGVYQVNPLTGRPYTAGIPSRIKILCLPYFYAALCDLFGVAPQLLVCRVIPVAVLVLSYLAYYGLARFFFPEEGEKRALFLLIVGLLFWAGGFLYGVEGFGLLYAGYRGVTIRGAVLLPMVVRAGLEKRILPVILCVLAEGCIVWTLYGAGQCLLVAVGLLVCGRIGKEAGSR